MKAEQPLVDRYLDGEITPEEQGRLAEWLAADAEHVRQFVRETSLHRQIRETMLARPYHAVGLSEVESPGPKESPPPVHWLARQWEQLFGFPWTPARWGAWALAGCLVLAAGLGVWCFGPTVGEPALAGVQGSGLSLERAGHSIPAVAGTRLQSGDIVRCPENVMATISYSPESTLVTLQPGTELKLASISHGKRFDLRAGKLEATVSRQRPFQPMVLITPQAEARVLGTKFMLTATTNATRLEVAEGKVKLTRISDGEAVKVPAGHYAVAGKGVELTALPRTGQILREVWTNLPGASWIYLITHTNYPDRPDGWGYLTNFARLEMPSDWADNFGVRLRGYIHPPKTGDYTFWIAAQDDASLWLSPDEDPENKVQMATSGGAAARNWESDAAQQSASLQLTAGRKYYFEVLHKAGVGEDHLAVAWQPPTHEREVILAEFLSPFKSDAKEKKR